MLSIAPLAPAEYYLGSSASSGEAFEYFLADKGAGGPDPLLRHGKWMGGLAGKLGLAPGTRIDRKDFESAYYGLDPKTGKPLRKDGKTVKQQMLDAQLRSSLQQDLDAKLSAYSKAREGLAKLGLSPSDPASLAKQAELDALKAEVGVAKKALDQAKQKSQRPGSDFVFSAPKSVSMMWAAWRSNGDELEAGKIEAAHDKAVRETMEAMQRQFILTRKRDAETSRRILEACNGMLAAQWRHFDARPSETNKGANDPLVPDPQLHDHITLLSPVEGQDGEIYAAYTDYARANIKALGAMYRAKLSAELASQGYAIERDVQKGGLFFKLAGIGKQHAAMMSSRAADIAENLAKSGALDADDKNLLKQKTKEAKLESRKAKNTLTGQEVLDAWKAKFLAMGINPEAAKRATLEASAKQQALDKSPGASAERLERMAEAIAAEGKPRERTNKEVIDQMLAMEAHFSLADIRQALWEDAQFAASQGSSEPLEQIVERRTREILATGDLLKVRDPDNPLAGGSLDGSNRFGEPVFTSDKLRARENELFGKTVPALVEAKGYGIDRIAAMAMIEKIEAAKTKELGVQFKLRDFQLRAVMQAACGDGQLAIQIAGAGLGKTTGAQFIKEILAANGRRIFAVAPSNKAAGTLGQELGVASSSIDKLLMDLRGGREQLDRNSVVFVDEAGMAGFEAMAELMERAAASGAKLIFIGDPEQLPAVARGNVLRKLTEMESLSTNPDALLYLGKELGDWDYVSRQKDGWAKQASTFFARGYVDEGLKEYERRGHVKTSLTREHLIEDIAAAYLADSAPAKEKLILGTTNEQVNMLNSAVREQLKKSGALTGAWTVKQTGLEVSIGDRIIFESKAKGADGEGSAAKNEFATVLGIRCSAQGHLLIHCQIDRKGPDGKPVELTLDTSKHSEIGHAFATTVHKSQGQTVDSVWAAPGSFISRELFYVMASRHRKSLNIHMLEHERAMVIANAGERIEKRHANDLQAVADQCPALASRLADSNDKYASLMDAARNGFERKVIGALAAVDAATAKAAKKVRKNELAGQAIELGLKIASNATSALASALAAHEPSMEAQAAFERARNLLGDMRIQNRKLVNWEQGREWLGHDGHFVYAKNVANGNLEAWPKAKQEKGMANAASQAKSIEAQAAALAEALDAKTRKSSSAIREAAYAWLGGPVEVDQAVAMNGGKLGIGIRARHGAPNWTGIAAALKEAGGHWSGTSWTFPAQASALSRLAEAGRSLGFETKAPPSPFDMLRERAWESIEKIRQEAAGGPNASPLAVSVARYCSTLNSSADLMRAFDQVADGQHANLFERSKQNPGRRNVLGQVVHCDSQGMVIAYGGSRALAITREELPPESWPADNMVGGIIEIEFGEDGAAAAIVQQTRPAEVSAALEKERQDKAIAAQEQSRLKAEAAKAAAQPAASQLLDDSSLKSLNSSMAYVAGERGRPKYARAIDEGRAQLLNFGSSQSFASGMIVGASKSSIYMMASERTIHSISRKCPALSGMGDEACLSLVGWKHDFSINGGAPQQLLLAEAGIPEAAAIDFAGKTIQFTALRADDHWVWLQAPKSLGGKSMKLSRDCDQLRGISHGVWEACVDGSFPMVLAFDGKGSLAAEPVNSAGSPIRTMDAGQALKPKLALEPELRP